MSNACKLLKHYQNHVQFHVQYCPSKYVITAQSNCINFFQCVDIPSTHKSSYLKTTGPHEGNLAMIYIKPFTCNCTTFLVSFFSEILFLLNIFSKIHPCANFEVSIIKERIFKQNTNYYSGVILCYI